MRRVVAMVIALLSFNGTVSHAREVQVVTLAGSASEARDGAVLDLGSDSPEFNDGLKDAMVHDFEALAPAYSSLSGVGPVTGSGGFASHIPSATSSVQVPRWLQTGTLSGRGGGSSISAALSLLTATCVDVPYRRRLDFPASTEARRARLYPLIARIACEAGVPAGLLDALVGQESRYNLSALSPKGAMGLTQLMPGTARYLKVANPWDPVANLRGGARYLREQIVEFGRVDLALAAYNAGPGRVRAGRRVPPYRETVEYVARITGAWSGAFPRSPVMPSSAPFATASFFFPPALKLKTGVKARRPMRAAQLVKYAS